MVLLSEKFQGGLFTGNPGTITIESLYIMNIPRQLNKPVLFVPIPLVSSSLLLPSLLALPLPSYKTFKAT
jgi:hypothetical protein